MGKTRNIYACRSKKSDFIIASKVFFFYLVSIVENIRRILYDKSANMRVSNEMIILINFINVRFQIGLLCFKFLNYLRIAK